MNDMNEVRIAGNVVREPETKTVNGQTVARITIASGTKWKDRASGETKEKTEFNPVTAWGPTADYIANYVKKGDHVLVAGKLTTRDYDDPKSGQHRWITEVQADRLYEHRKPKARGNTQASDPYADAAKQAQKTVQSLQNEEFDMNFGEEVNIPF